VDIQTKRSKRLVICLFGIYSESLSVDLHQTVPQLLICTGAWNRFHNPVQSQVILRVQIMVGYFEGTVQEYFIKLRVQ
jgi:hypothetical protein